MKQQCFEKKKTLVGVSCIVMTRCNPEELRQRQESLFLKMLPVTQWPNDLFIPHLFSCSGPSAVCCGRQCGGGQSGQQNSEGQTVPLGRGARWDPFTCEFTEHQVLPAKLYEIKTTLVICGFHTDTFLKAEMCLFCSVTICKFSLKLSLLLIV